MRTESGNGWTIYLGDCLDVLPTLAETSVDAIVTDPPYGLSAQPDIAEVMRHWLAGEKYEHGSNGFMGKSWDSFVPGPEYWKEVYRVAKPGAMALVFGGTRTFDLMSIALRFANFESRDCLMWVYGQGFPKSANISKLIDKSAGAERVVVGNKVITGCTPDRENFGANDRTDGKGMGFRPGVIPLTAPATDLAKKWDGYGTALKPSFEPVLLFMKAVDENFAGNAEKWGVAGINVDGGRIGTGELAGKVYRNKGDNLTWGGTYGKGTVIGNSSGRWPANLLLDDAAGEMIDKQSGERSSGKGNGNALVGEPSSGNIPLRRGNLISRDDKGGASRFFQHCNYTETDRMIYAPKASRRERESGLEDIEVTTAEEATGRQEGSTGLVRDSHSGDTGNPYKGTAPVKSVIHNNHPSIKPLSLMEYLVTLVSMPGGSLILDPFMGSGTTIIAAINKGQRAVGIEKDEHYFEIALARIRHAESLLANKTTQLELEV